MSTRIRRFIADAIIWAFCITLVGFLSAAGVIDNPAIALAGGALWWAIRAYSKADVNTVHKLKTEA